MDKSIIYFCAAILASCSSPRPNEVDVDQEALAIDLPACIDGGGACTTKGAQPSEAFLSGTHALFLPKGASLDAPLLVPAGATHLRYLVVAVSSRTPDLTTPHHLQIVVDGLTRSVSPLPGFTRTEIDMQGPPDASGDSGPPLSPTSHVQLQTVDGDGFDVLWVVGRWKD